MVPQPYPIAIIKLHKLFLFYIYIKFFINGENIMDNMRMRILCVCIWTSVFLSFFIFHLPYLKQNLRNKNSIQKDLESYPNSPSGLSHLVPFCIPLTLRMMKLHFRKKRCFNLTGMPFQLHMGVTDKLSFKKVSWISCSFNWYLFENKGQEL